MIRFRNFPIQIETHPNIFRTVPRRETIYPANLKWFNVYCWYWYYWLGCFKTRWFLLQRVETWIWLIRQARPFWFNHYRSHWHLGVIDLLLLRQSHLFPTSILGLFIVLIIVCGLNSVSDQYKRWKWLAWSIHPCTHTHRWHVDKYHNRMLPAIFHGDPSNQSIFFQKHVWLMCVHHLESRQDLNSRPCYFQWSTGNLVIYDMIS